jgi:hypothetical protein
MMFNTPQFIDVEDKIAGPLTWRQLLWMIGMGALLLMLFMLLEGAVIFVVGVPVVILFLLLAFYRPGGQPFIQYILNAFFFLFRPKVMMWDRPIEGILRKPIMKKTGPVEQRTSKGVTEADIHRIAEMVDKR